MPEPRLYLGGSFDPVHLGHLQSIELLRQRLSLDEAFLLPAKRSPLKEQTHVSDQHRLAMLQLALNDYPQLRLDTREVYRERASYTILTLQELRHENPNTSLLFAMGMDSFLGLDHWRDWQQLTDYTHLVVFSRPGYQPKPNPTITQWLKTREINSPVTLHQKCAGFVYFTELEPYAVSSSVIRDELSCGQLSATTEACLPSSVYNYIKQNSLYGLTS